MKDLRYKLSLRNVSTYILSAGVPKIRINGNNER